MKALITGINGQDGAFLAKHLQGKGYDVIGITRKNTATDNLDYVQAKPRFYYGDISEPDFVTYVIGVERPAEIYNLAAQSHVGQSFRNPTTTMAVNYGGLVNIINSVKRIKPNTRIYQAGTSEMFGGENKQVFDESSKFLPKSPYAIAKLAAHYAGLNARKEGIWVSNGILFNHESPIRGHDFVTRKITLAIARGDKLRLGNIHAARDWGYAGDYVKAMHHMLQLDRPDDFVIATNETHTVKEFITRAFATIGKEITYEGHAEHEVGIVDGKVVMQVDPKFYRPNDVNYLQGDFSYAKACLQWRPTTTFAGLVEMMMREDMRRHGNQRITVAA